MAFHNARNDAWYTALVFQTLPDPAAVLNYGQKPKALIHKPRKIREKTPDAAFPSVREALESETARNPVCPRCGRILTLDGEYVPQSPDKYVAIGKCRHHGKMLLRLTLQLDEENQVLIRRHIAPASHSNIAYVHTKQFLAEKNRDPGAPAPDPDAALRQAKRSSMPFEI